MTPAVHNTHMHYSVILVPKSLLMVANNIQEFWSRQYLITIVAFCSVQVIILRTKENSSNNQMVIN